MSDKSAMATAKCRTGGGELGELADNPAQGTRLDMSLMACAFNYCRQKRKSIAHHHDPLSVLTDGQSSRKGETNSYV